MDSQSSYGFSLVGRRNCKNVDILVGCGTLGESVVGSCEKKRVRRVQVQIFGLLLESVPPSGRGEVVFAERRALYDRSALNEQARCHRMALRLSPSPSCTTRARFVCPYKNRSKQAIAGSEHSLGPGDVARWTRHLRTVYAYSYWLEYG